MNKPVCLILDAGAGIGGPNWHEAFTHRGLSSNTSPCVTPIVLENQYGSLLIGYSLNMKKPPQGWLSAV